MFHVNGFKNKTLGVCIYFNCQIFIDVKNDTSFHFHRWGEVSAFNTPHVWSQHKLLDFFPLTVLGICRIDFALNPSDDARVGDHLGGVGPFDSLAGAPRLEEVELGLNQKHRVLLVFAGYHTLLDEGRHFEGVFHGLGRDVLASGGLENFFLAVGDSQVALSVEFSDVSGAEPTVLSHHLGGEVGAVVVAHHHVGALGEDLAVGVQLEFDAVDGGSHGAQLVALAGGQVNRQNGRRFGEAVAHQQLDADRLEEAIHMDR